MSWQEQAACLGRTDVNFFPKAGESPKEALAVCAECPVQRPCLDEALKLAYHDDHGVRAGTTAKERDRMRKT